MLRKSSAIVFGVHFQTCLLLFMESAANCYKYNRRTAQKSPKIYVCIFIYIYMCVNVCVCVWEREKKYLKKVSVAVACIWWWIIRGLTWLIAIFVSFFCGNI